MSFDQDFHRKIEEIEQRAARVGTNWTQICRQLGMSRTTPDRWHHRTPDTIALVARIERHLDALDAEKQARNDQSEAPAV